MGHNHGQYQTNSGKKSKSTFRKDREIRTSITRKHLDKGGQACQPDRCWRESSEKGLPLSVVLSGANTHDIKLLEATLDSIVISRPTVSEEYPQNLCLDAGYTGSSQSVEDRQYTAHIRPRGEERKEIKRKPEFKARRWVVEVTHSFFNRFRKVLVRFERKAQNYLALIHFACSIIVWRKLIQVHQ